ncbi:MAG: hypothetical protein NCW75_02575 [Phycisphaera sp.]|nr:MAG: hypothetical protein NCW75_02575 [Phycisphaera sp.]
MNVHPPTTATAVYDRQRDFSAVIARDDTPASAQGSARRAAEDFVAMAFVEPLLAELREGNNAAPPFAPGPAEKQFGEIMDQVMSRQIVRASNFGLVDRLEADLSQRSAQLAEGVVA